MARKTAGKAKAKAAVKDSAAVRTPGKIGKSIELENVRQLVQMMVDNDLNELTVAEGDTRVELKRGMPMAAVPTAMAMPAAVAAAPAAGVHAAAPAPAGEAKAPEGEKLLEIASPMVGTYYAAASPDSDPYVAVGQRVGADTVVCIVEAMKVMNEIRAEISGVIAEVCVENAQPVEYGQVLFRVRPG